MTSKVDVVYNTEAASKVDYLIARIVEKNRLLHDAMIKLQWTDSFDYERHQLAREIEEHLNEATVLR